MKPISAHVGYCRADDEGGLREVHLGGLLVLNPGSVNGVTARDSATCATLDLATRSFRVFDLCTGTERPVARAAR
ncbi:MAG: metallophosphoesterase family protein [Chloroflexales bacterium]|nr:metallophosphoesterase family protein [Chloroflexales bacterium]